MSLSIAFIPMILILFTIITLLIMIGFLLLKLYKLKQKAKQILSALDEIQQGNLNRRILAANNDFTDEICYKINQISQIYIEQLSQADLIEKTNKQIMTSLSHDLRTPLTTLLGYLDAMQDNTISSLEREKYIEIVQLKAYAIKKYTDDLFEWFKINSNEKSYHFETVDINELSRNLVIDWIPQFEKAGFDYEIEIMEQELNTSLDITAYRRIFNNIVYNAIQHSGGTHIRIAIKDCNDSVLITISDNGKGIAEKDLPYIFDRLYTCDAARPIGSSGLGLSIVNELVKAHDGTILVESIPNVETSFLVNMKKT